MCNHPMITPSSSFESISSYSPSSSLNDRRYHMKTGMSSKSMSNSFGKENHFLDYCSLCKTKLYLGDDIYMYKGDTPFCSEECRQDQIDIDERNEKMKSKTSMWKAATSIKIDDVQVRSVAATVFA